MSRFQSLPDLVEDFRHALMQFRRYATRADLDAVKGGPRAILNMAHRDIDAAEDPADADRRELELADYLVGQYEAAVVILGSMIPD